MSDSIRKSELIDWLRGKKYITVDETSDIMSEDFENKHRWELSRNCFINDTIKHIQEQPTIEAYGTWIPCSERLPEKSGTYIVTGAWKGEPRETWMCELWVLGSFGAGWCNDARKPIIDAWMPLPEPYKGGDQNE